MQDRRLHQPDLRLSEDLHDARRERLLPAPIRMHRASNKVRRKLQEAHQEGEKGLKGSRMESRCVGRVYSFRSTRTSTMCFCISRTFSHTHTHTHTHTHALYTHALTSNPILSLSLSLTHTHTTTTASTTTTTGTTTTTTTQHLD